jgi:ABC-type transporter Mla subunit MlaD
MNDAFRLVQAQSDLMTDLPAIIAELQESVRSLSETLAYSKDTAASAQRVIARLESVLDDIEEPVRAMRPGLQRLSVALDSPVIDRLPATLETIERTVLPVAARIEQTSERAHAMGARWALRTGPLRKYVARVRSAARGPTGG